jgi:uncharacterized membrane protein
MESRAKLSGHAIYPILIVFPLGLLGMAVVLDLLYSGPAWRLIRGGMRSGGVNYASDGLPILLEAVALVVARWSVGANGAIQ